MPTTTSPNTPKPFKRLRRLGMTAGWLLVTLGAVILVVSLLAVIPTTESVICSAFGWKSVPPTELLVPSGGGLATVGGIVITNSRK